VHDVDAVSSDLPGNAALADRSEAMLAGIEQEPLSLSVVPRHFAVLGEIADLWWYWGSSLTGTVDRERVESHTARFLRCYERVEDFCDSSAALDEALEQLADRAFDRDPRPVLFEAGGSFAVGPAARDVALKVALSGLALRRVRHGGTDRLLVRAPRWLHAVAFVAADDLGVGSAFDDPGDDVREVLVTLWDPLDGTYGSVHEALEAARALA